MQMREIDYGAIRRRTHRILLATGVGLMLAFPAASAQAQSKADNGANTPQTCAPANANGIDNSQGTAAGAATNACPQGHGSGGSGTGHKVG
jgi:hypothetical protein